MKKKSFWIWLDWINNYFLEKKAKKTKSLDDLFRKTKALPKIYWLPLTPEQVGFFKTLRHFGTSRAYPEYFWRIYYEIWEHLKESHLRVFQVLKILG